MTAAENLLTGRAFFVLAMALFFIVILALAIHEHGKSKIVKTRNKPEDFEGTVVSNGVLLGTDDIMLLVVQLADRRIVRVYLDSEERISYPKKSYQAGTPVGIIGTPDDQEVYLFELAK